MKLANIFTKSTNPSPYIIKKVLGSQPELDKSTVFRLELMSKKVFIIESRNIICQASGIPKALWPAIKPINLLYNGMRAFYDCFHNIINYDVILQTEKRAKFFSTFTHEITHAKQNFDILRTKKLGKSHVKFLAHIKTLCETTLCPQNYKNVYKENLRFFNEQRRKIIKEMGSLPFDNETAKINYNMAMAIQADKKSAPYTFQKGSPEYELEAYLAGKIVKKRYLQHM